MTAETRPLRVLFLTLYPETMPSSRLRVYQYLPELARLGFQTKVLPAVPEPWFSRLYFSKLRALHAVYVLLEAALAFWRIAQAKNYDVVFVQKGIVSTNLRGFAAQLLRVSRRVIFDFDDDILGRTMTEFRHPFLARLQDRREAEYVAAASACVIAGNEYLRGRVLPVNKSVVVIPTPVDTGRFCPAGRKAGEPASAAPLVIGWIGMEIGMSYLRSLAGVLQKLAAQQPVRLKVISRLQGGGKFSLPGVQTEFVPWSYEAEVREMQAFDIGIMPVRADEWGPGKCGLKLLQYMALGLPAVASQIGANSDIVDDGVDAFLASTDEEWLERLLLLCRDANLRRRLGERARKKVEEVYSLKVMTVRLAEVLQGQSQYAAKMI